MTVEVEFTVLCPFGGSGGGGLGFTEAEARLFDTTARFKLIGSIDSDEVACDDFEAFTGAPAWRTSVEDITPSQLRSRYGPVAPDVVFMSPPCKGSSRLLPSEKAKSAKYKAMNRLALVWTRVMLAAWQTPPALLLLENVPGLPSRAAGMLGELRHMLTGAGYVIHDEDHDCGEIGGLAQHRRRYLLVARRPDLCPSLLYQPRKRRVRAVGEVLTRLPMPATIAAAEWGQLHEPPRLKWRNTVRLALIPAGGDWRDLDGVLQGRKRREVFRRLAVQAWDRPHPTVTGPGGHATESVADPRAGWYAGALGVLDWQGPSGTITGGADNPSKGRFAVADLRVARAFDAGYGVLDWGAPARTIAATNAVGCGAYAAADPRERDRFVDSVKVMTIDEAIDLDLDPDRAPPFVPVIVAADGTWHRSLTRLEMSALQGYPLTMHGRTIPWNGTRTQIAEHIGNSVPPPAAKAIAERMLFALLESSVGSWSLGSPDTPVWVERQMSTDGHEGRKHQ